jgi:hypothetical protein
MKTCTAKLQKLGIIFSLSLDESPCCGSQCSRLTLYLPVTDTAHRLQFSKLLVAADALKQKEKLECFLLSRDIAEN